MAQGKGARCGIREERGGAIAGTGGGGCLVFPHTRDSSGKSREIVSVPRLRARGDDTAEGASEGPLQITMHPLDNDMDMTVADNSYEVKGTVHCRAKSSHSSHPSRRALDARLAPLEYFIWGIEGGGWNANMNLLVDLRVFTRTNHCVRSRSSEGRFARHTRCRRQRCSPAKRAVAKTGAERIQRDDVHKLSPASAATWHSEQR